jgi:hypothetical protein
MRRELANIHRQYLMDLNFQLYTGLSPRELGLSYERTLALSQAREAHACGSWSAYWLKRDWTKKLSSA